MQNFPAAYKQINDSMAKRPVYVFEIIWAGGGPGVSGTNDIYFTTCDVNDILNFPYPARWFPFLDAESISGISQSVDPINGVSTIGQLSVSITDYGGMVSNIIKAADVAGHGLRRQRCEVSMLYKGMDWADKVRVRSMYVEDLKLANYNQYKLTCTDVQAQMRKTVFNPAKTKLSGNVAATGAVTLNVTDTYFFNLVESVKLGVVGFVKIGDEIMYFTAKTTNTLTVPAAGRGMFGSAAAAHAIDDQVDELIYLNENPITMALKILESSGVASANGAFDVCPAVWGCNMKNVDAVDQAGWLQIGEQLTGLSTSHLPGDGLQFEFLLDAGVEAKEFIEDRILKIIGAYGFVRGDGSYSIRAYNDLANAAKENAVAVLNEHNIVSWGELSYSYTDLANEMWIEYLEWPKLSGKYTRVGFFVDSVSQKKWGVAKQLSYTADGIPPDSVFIDQLFQRFQRVMARYSRPPMKIPLTLMPKMHGQEIGDIVRVTLPIRDLVSGATLDRAFEIVSTALKPKTGEIDVECIAQPERDSRWYGGIGGVATVVISPAAASIPVGTTQQLTAQCFDGLGTPVPTPAISWVATGGVTVDANGLVTAGGSAGSGTVYAVVGVQLSNNSNITVTASANGNAVALVSIAPAETTLEAAQTKSVTATAYDVAINQVNGVTFTWASSNPAVATVPAGPSVSATVTAVANGTANITATETVSSIASPAMAVTVATAPPPPQTVLTWADSAYQIGTQITTMGGVGGPHTIPNGYNFAAGDYWFDGDVLLATGSTCTINGTVRIFSQGVVTINGTVDGVGRGGAAATTGSSYVMSSRKYGTGSAAKEQYWAAGAAATSQGFLGKGGIGGYALNIYGVVLVTPAPAGSANPINQSKPLLDIVGTAVDGAGDFTDMSGVPVNAMGGGGSASGPGHLYTNVLGDPWNGAAGGNGGAGFVIVARGIYISIGEVRLNGANTTYGTGQSASLFCGGPGGGGTFIALAERGVGWLETKSIDPGRIHIDPGVVVGQTLNAINAVPVVPATPGCFIEQSIPF